MFDFDQFIKGTRVLDRDISSNRNQFEAVSAPYSASLKIVAGPGSGKTTVIVLRIMKIILVDGIDPSHIMATTFTKKAMDELKSRILSWGEKLRQFFLESAVGEVRSWLIKINFNAVITGTLDSISQTTLMDNRLPGEAPPIMIEEYVSSILMLKQGLFENHLHNNPDFDSELGKIFGIEPRGRNVSNKCERALGLNYRLKENTIPFDYLTDYPLIQKCLKSYEKYLNDHLLLDFPTLEKKYLTYLIKPESSKYRNNIQFLLVDEYQDTNLLQEKIYFELAKNIIINGGSVVIVGDDDQSIYRFRGSRVHLFSKIEERSARIGVTFKKIYLNTNYRSTQSIVNFCNNYIELDQEYQEVRIDKPKMMCGRSCDDYPIYGLFRDNVQDLAHDLADIIIDVVYRGGHIFTDVDGKKHTIQIDSVGSIADVVYLSSSVSEKSSDRKRDRLPLKLRGELSIRLPSVEVFNPRGQDLQDMPEIEKLCGILMLCIDPDSSVLDGIFMRDLARQRITEWINRARRYIDTCESVNGVKLSDYVSAWQNGKPFGTDKWDKNDVTITDIIYNIITWIPRLQSDAENLVYLEAICRVANSSSLVNPFGSKIWFENHKPTANSVKAALNDVFIPLASGVIDINEDLLSTIPQDRLNIMSIHQAKGLEFPFTIVDVGSDFKNNNHAQKFLRFPENPDRTSNEERFIKQYSEEIIESHDDLGRSFDDLVRKYYVGFSRAQDVLMLVGLTKSRDACIRNIATGWSRDGIWQWAGLRNISQQ
ncbi:MAG: ATP-dependent helicase [Candidatus Methanoplasma sp.]|jgi:DNA helicase-2/ATP-dependent DNA helicase PcrA|nr:ATP-dependent helicase [Candidatus Methanoplasma sp.]